MQQLSRQVASLESSSRALAAALQEKEGEVERVTREFTGYKLRAQSVLKQSKDQQVEEAAAKKQEEIFAMEKLNDALNDKLKSLSLEVRTVQVERRGLQEEHDRLMERQSLLLQELATKEKGWRERSEQQEGRVVRAEEERAAGVERVQRSVESLRQGHLQEAELLRAGHREELARVQQVLDTRENEVIRLEMVLSKEQEARRQAEEAVGSRGGLSESLDISQIEREAAEGQEVDPPTPGLWSSLTSPLPLEQLLAQTDRAGGTRQRLYYPFTQR